jgi:hypothetical protein
VPTTAAPSDDVLTASFGFTTRLRFALAVLALGDSESVTVTVIGDVPDVVGVPEMAPVELFRDSPAGRVPVVTAQL